MIQLSSVRIIPRVETAAPVVRFAKTILGQLAMIALFLSVWHGFYRQAWYETAALLVATTLLPRYRRQLLGLAVLYLAFCYYGFDSGLITGLQKKFAPGGGLSRTWMVAIVSAVFMSCLLLEQAARRIKRPILCTLILYVASLGAVEHIHFRQAQLMVWAFLIVFGKYLWYLCYSLKDARSRDRQPFWMQLCHYRPFYSPQYIPVPKGGAGQRKIECQTAEELAVCQLKGLKLLVWAAILELVRTQLLRLCDRAGVPHLLGVVPHHHDYSILNCWWSAISHFVLYLLELAVKWDVMVAGCRMFGFRAPRSMYRPLESASIAEFWNRVVFYFKEMLAELFFYPTYFALFKKHPRLRLFSATFVAAGLGNFLYHLLRAPTLLLRRGLGAAVWEFRTYALYCAILGCAIGLSQLRNQGRPRPSGFRPASFIFIFGFYCFMEVLDATSHVATLKQYSGFILTLFGVRIV